MNGWIELDWKYWTDLWWEDKELRETEGLNTLDNEDVRNKWEHSWTKSK